MPERCLILVAHGSRDPRWCAPFERLAAELGAELAVELGFLELAEPSFAVAVGRAIDRGARELVVLPLFMAGGAHVDRDLPALVAAARAAHPDALVTQLPPVGEHPRFTALIAELIRESYHPLK